MPPKQRITREMILERSFAMFCREGMEAVNARSVAKALNCSTQPIFSNYQSMEELKKDALAYADRLYQSYLSADMGSGEFPPYKASGMAYIRFAKEEKELFRLLFMRDRTGETLQEDRNIDGIMELIRQNTGMDEEHARLFHIEMWIYVHGIATMCATSYLDWDKDMISRMLTDAYEGMRLRYELKGDTG